MTITAQYASVPKNGIAQLSVANPNVDGTGALVTVVVGSPKTGGGARLDGLVIKAVGATTNGLIRLFLVKGRPLGDIASISFTTTTATVTTVLAHGLSTGQLLTQVGTLPDEYNVFDAAVTVLSPTTFTYPMASAPTTNATVLGAGTTTPAVLTARLLVEIPVSAVTPSAVTPSFTVSPNIGSLILQQGWTLRASTQKAELFNVIPTVCGDFV